MNTYKEEELLNRIIALEQRVRYLQDWRSGIIRKLCNRRLLQDHEEVFLSELINDIDPLGQG